MNIILAILVIALVIWTAYRIFYSSGKDDYNRSTSGYDHNTNNYDRGEEKKTNHNNSTSYSSPPNKIADKRIKPGFFANIFSAPLPFDDEAINWCANFLLIDKKMLVKILRNTADCYTDFKIRKRSGGYRTISAPNTTLLSIQKVIYKRVLLSANVHPAGMGFRQNTSVADNAKAHLRNKQLLKIDIADFFGAIKKHRVLKAFEKIGYPSNISKVLAELCTLRGKLPQGAATSPSLSNVIAYDLDVKLTALAKNNKLTYTRYADDLTFSGEAIDYESLFSQVDDVIREEKFVAQRKKTRYLTENKKKIVTGVSISSGKKMTIPKAKKREIRKTVHYVLTKGLVEHQRFIGSTDPSYLKRLIGYLNFWLMVEPDNIYVKKSIDALKKVETASR